MKAYLGACLTAWFLLLMFTVSLPTATTSRPARPVTREQCERLGGDWLVTVDTGRCVGAER